LISKENDKKFTNNKKFFVKCLWNCLQSWNNAL